jgi:16S rRNA (guanine966-N2)-methyltransferase
VAVRSVPLPGRLRIIGGRWRGRRLSFPAIDGLRPTPDRVRETLFNWLAPGISGARCLDLFACSGALGIEALSRGAGEVVFVEHHPLAARGLRENLMLLGVEYATVEETDALAWLRGSASAFDVILLDPPFGRGLLTPVCQALEQGHWLAPGAVIYLEAERERRALPLPANWQVLRAKTAGQVAYSLMRRRLETTRIISPSE